MVLYLLVGYSIHQRRENLSTHIVGWRLLILPFFPLCTAMDLLVRLHFRLAGNKSGYSDIGLHLGTAGAESLTAILDGGISILEHHGPRHYW